MCVYVYETVAHRNLVRNQQCKAGKTCRQRGKDVKGTGLA